MTESIKGRGRPRSEATRHAILEAAFAVLAKRGYADFTIEQVAEAAGAGKSTIYRWWTGKMELAVESFFAGTEHRLRFSQTGSARDDFRVQITELAAMLRGANGRVLAAMLIGGLSDPALARTLGERWLEPRRAWGFARISRAVAEGECRANIDKAAALGLLYGPIYTPLLFGQDVPGAEQVDAHLALALPAIFI